MSPILGIYASQISGHLWAPSGAYDSIATAVGTGSSGTITFSSIPSTYTHLQIRLIANTGASANINVRYNSDTGSNYAYHQLVGDGSSASAAAVSSSTVQYGGYSTSSDYGVAVIDILDYANTNKYKTLRSLHGSDANGAGLVLLRSGLWQNTNAINTINLISTSGNFTTGSSFALYGIRGN